MTEMVDPYIGLQSFQRALLNGLIVPSPCEIYPEISILKDDADEQPRLTYALIDNNTVKATVVYVPAQPIDGVCCFDVGYSVAENFRNQGIATQVLEKSIAEMRRGFGRHMKKFYIEAVIGTSNFASQKVASKVLSTDSAPRETIDSVSGQPALVYTRLIEC
jgi:hypothetical protein